MKTRKILKLSLDKIKIAKLTKHQSAKVYGGTLGRDCGDKSDIIIDCPDDDDGDGDNSLIIVCN